MDKHHLYGSVARLNHLFSVDWKRTFRLRTNIIWSDEPQFQVSCLKEGTAHHLQSTIPKVKCAGSSLMLWGCFSAAGTEGLVRVEEKLNAPKYWDSLNENPVQSIQKLRWAEGLPSNRTIDLKTQQEWLIHTMLWMSWSGPARACSNPIKYFWRNLKMCVYPHPTWQSLRGEEKNGR